MLKRDLQKVLSDSVINPKTDISYRFVLELDDPLYCVTKVAEMLSSKSLDDATLKQAITLLGIARVLNGRDPKKQVRVSRKPKNRVGGNLKSPYENTRGTGDNKSPSNPGSLS